MKTAQLSEIRARLAAQEALAAERSRGLAARLQALFALNSAETACGTAVPILEPLPAALPVQSPLEAELFEPIAPESRRRRMDETDETLDLFEPRAPAPTAPDAWADDPLFEPPATEVPEALDIEDAAPRPDAPAAHRSETLEPANDVTDARPTPAQALLMRLGRVLGAEILALNRRAD